MLLDRLNQTAEEYWGAFEHFNDSPTTLPQFSRETDKIRFIALLAFTSIDAQINAFWVTRVLPEWHEMASLINTLLNDRDEISYLLESCGADFNQAQLISSLRFISLIHDPLKFTPSFTDCGLMWLVLNNSRIHEEKVSKLAHILFHLQKIRNSCFHTNREFNELKGKEALFLFQKWKDLAPSMHPAFSAPDTWDLGSHQIRAA